MDTSGDQALDIGEFKNLLRTLDHELKSLPATAQVASQQGKYLGIMKRERQRERERVEKSKCLLNTQWREENNDLSL